ncbi:MAG TPA: glycosyltransferase family 39 protein [Thermoleophilaceae bacterium]
MTRRLRAAASPVYLALLLIVAVGLVLRVLHNTYGLPYVYNIDEGSHFTNRAIGMFGGSADPGYYQNPSAYTYLVHLALRFQYGIGHVIPFGHYSHAVRQYSENPTPIYRTSRTLAALLCMLGVVGVFWVGRRLWGALEGIAAAAVLSFAFLPVAYSRVAVTDVGALLPVALALYASVRIYEDGRRRHYVLGGAMAGLAFGFKYTAGLVLVPVAIAAIARLRRNPRAIVEGLIALACAVGVFFITNPYVFINFSDAWHQLKGEQQLAGKFAKLGQEGDNGPTYYLDSLTWGFGWAAAIGALVGAVVEARRSLMRALLLAVVPVALFIYLSTQVRFFGRWLLPAYPALALLAGVAIAALVRLVPGRPLVRAAALAAVILGVIAQPIFADVRTARLLGRTDTRELARQWLVKHYRTGLRIVIEPAVPPRFYNYVESSGRINRKRRQFIRGFIRDINDTHEDYGSTLTPQTLNTYRRSGFCLVMSMSLIRGRVENAQLAPALAYYDALKRQSKLLLHVSPYKRGAKPVKFNFDLSYNYYPTAFARPGPEIWIYRLNNCKQGYGGVPVGIGTPKTGNAPGIRR